MDSNSNEIKEKQKRIEDSAKTPQGTEYESKDKWKSRVFYFIELVILLTIAGFIGDRIFDWYDARYEELTATPALLALLALALVFIIYYSLKRVIKTKSNNKD